MTNEIEKRGEQGITKAAAELPAGTLWRDLRAEIGRSNGIEWLMLFEDDPVTIRPLTRLVYAKVVILTPEGRKFAQNGQNEILRKCNLHKHDTAWICRALAVAMNLWDREH